jgi:hypothetical protein
MALVEASVITTKCGKSGKIYGIRVEKSGDDWIRTWAFPIKDDVAKREGYDKNIIRGSLRCTDEYPGCPYCGGKSLLLCQNCSRVSCYEDETPAHCPWCGATSDTHTVDEFEINGEER